MRTTVTILLTSGRSVTGSFEHGEQRLSDALNGSLASVLRIADATLGRFGNPAANEPVAVAVVPKNHAALVIPNEERRRTNDKRMYAYVPQQTSELLVLLAGLRIRGTAHAAAHLDEVGLHRQLSETDEEREQPQEKREPLNTVVVVPYLTHAETLSRRTPWPYRCPSGQADGHKWRPYAQMSLDVTLRDEAMTLFGKWPAPPQLLLIRNSRIMFS